MEHSSLFLFTVITICYQNIFVNAIIGNSILTVNNSEYPAVCSIADINPNPPYDRNTFCTGTFITLYHIISSQHCFDNDVGNKYFGIISESSDMLLGRIFSPWWWTTYDKWARVVNIPLNFHDNDVAIIRIFGDPPNRMIPATVSSISPQSLLYGLQVQILGFGRTNTQIQARKLLKAHVQVLTLHQCEQALFDATGEFLPVHPRYLCTVSNPYTLLAEGDSGGPLFFQGTIVGVHRATCSNLLPMDHPNRVNVHLGTEFYRNFITELTRF